MHEYRRYVEREMNARHWTQADLARAAGLDRQIINSITRDTRETLPGVPRMTTVHGLARAFSVKPEVVLAHVALAMGLPVSVEQADVADLSDADLLLEVRRRMEARHDRQDDTEPGPEAGGTLNSSESSSPDGGTPGRPGAPISDLQLERDRRQQEADAKPLEDLLGLAADKGERMDDDE